MAKSIISEVDRQFLGCQMPNTVIELIQGEAMKIFITLGMHILFRIFLFIPTYIL